MVKIADQHNDNIPAVGNQISSDIPDIKENLEWHKDCFQAICNGFDNASLTNLGFLKTIYIPASAMSPMTTNGAQAGIYEYTTNDTVQSYYAFDGTTEEQVSISFPFLEGWDRSTIKARFYWSSDTGSTAGDTVEWEIALTAISNSDALDVAWGGSQVISDTLLANSGADLQITAATPAITVQGTPALRDMVTIKVSRNVAGTDNMVEDAWLFGVWIQINCTMPDASGTNAIAAW